MKARSRVEAKNKAISQRVGFRWIYKRLMENQGLDWGAMKRMPFFTAAKILSIENAMI